METLNIKKLTKNGRYTYIGFVLIKEEEMVKTGRKIKNDVGVLIDEAKLVKGEVASIFRAENSEILFVSTCNIKDTSEEKPFGVFQKFMSSFNASFDIKINKCIVDIFIESNEENV